MAGSKEHLERGIGCLKPSMGYDAVEIIRAAAKGKFGVYHQKERDDIPLKVFTKCGNSYTGYLVKAKNLYYYKCRTNGCKCNMSAKRMNEQFVTFLQPYILKEEMIAPVQRDMTTLYHQRNKEDSSQSKELKQHLKEIEKY